MRNKLITVFLLILLVLTSCSSPEQPTDGHMDDVSAVEISSDDDSNQADSESADNESSESAGEASSDTENTPVPPPSDDTPVPEVVHWEFPGTFKLSPLQSIFDCITGRYFIPGQEYELSEVCDQWERNYFERPVDADIVEFYPQLDIVQSEFGQDVNWYYTRIMVFSELVENLVLDGVYAIEIDLDLDARGDILITAAAPGSYPADEWHSNGVQVWLDKNDDVGGPQAMLVDPSYAGDGYEELIYDAGVGEDPDLAYIKIYSDTPGLLEFGFKAALLGGAESFEWWVWAMGVDLTAAKYDPVDFFPQDTLFALDNTCGWIFGSYPRELPNICQTLSAPPQSVEGACQPPPAGCDPKLCEFWDQASCSCKIDYSCFN